MPFFHRWTLTTILVEMNRLTPDMHSLLNEDIVKELNKRNIYTVLDLIRAIKADRRVVEKISNLHLREIVDLNKCLLKNFGPCPKNAFEKYQTIIHQSAILQTGIVCMDKLIDGGLFTGYIYEMCGLPSTGKTFFCLSLAKHVLTTTKDQVYYIDTKHDFSAIAFRRMLTDHKDQAAEILSRLLVARVHTRTEFLNTLLSIRKQLRENQTCKLLIIDSLPALYFLSSNHSENNSFLNYTGNVLNYLVNECNIVVLATNLVTLWNDGDFKNVDTMKERISCGGYWSNIPNVRLKLKKIDDTCVVNLTKALKVMPFICECQMRFTPQGFV
ncbi:unnamed protein product [Acanthoscelides obtectus]|uniref:RecA family profile 1 domain-containing protein n=1 Tax=Acanthoscelides obtectus TaxID=200917 RepID=A0A9P0M9N2_ACAOB|nr:unnamed protein product [Acanthoscelides obtectus]CAK1624610.1 DNA repair protein RAD51 homolog 4 [Acanthoscelides obtectus]